MLKYIGGNMMFYYKLYNKTLVSRKKYSQLEEISEGEAASDTGRIFVLDSSPPGESRRSFCASQPDLICALKEDLDMLLLPESKHINLPDWIIKAVSGNNATRLNTEYPSWQDVLLYETPAKWRINVAGLGDVGGTLVSGLRLLGVGSVSHIGIFDIDPNKSDVGSMRPIKYWIPTAEMLIPMLFQYRKNSFLTVICSYSV